MNKYNYTVKPKSGAKKTRVAERSCTQHVNGKIRTTDLSCTNSNKQTAPTKVQYDLLNRSSSFTFSNNLVTRGSSNSDKRAILSLAEAFDKIEDLDNLVLPERGAINTYIVDNHLRPIIKMLTDIVGSAVAETNDVKAEAIKVQHAMRAGELDKLDINVDRATTRFQTMFILFGISLFCIVYNSFVSSTPRRALKWVGRIAAFSAIWSMCSGFAAPSTQGVTDAIDDYLSRENVGPVPESGEEIDFDVSVLITPLVGLIICGNSMLDKSINKKTLVASLTAMWIAKKPLTEMVTFLIESFEKAYNKLQDKYGNGSKIRILKSSVDGVEDKVSVIIEILNSNARGEYFRTRDNYDYIKKTLHDTRCFIRSCPSDIRNEVVRVLRPYEKRLVDLEEEFGKVNFCQSGIRPEPVVAMFHGGPGTAKSIAMNAFSLAVTAHTIPDVMAESFREQPNSFVYNRSISQEFWDGYTNQWTTMVEEVGQNLPSQSGVANEFAELIAMANTAPMSLRMASLEQKGTKFFTSRFVTCTSNSRNFTNSCLVSTEAFMRRLDFKYVVTPKPKYTQDSQLGNDHWNRKIDMTKLPSQSVSVSTPHGVADYETSDLNEYSLDYWPSDNEGKPLTVTPLSFDEIVALAVDLSFTKLAWYEGHRLRMTQTIAQALDQRTFTDDSSEIDMDEIIFPEGGLIYPDSERESLKEEGEMLIYREDWEEIRKVDSSHFEEIYQDINSFLVSHKGNSFLSVVNMINGRDTTNDTIYQDFVVCYKFLRYYGGQRYEDMLYTGDSTELFNYTWRIVRNHAVALPAYYNDDGYEGWQEKDISSWDSLHEAADASTDRWMNSGRKRMSTFFEENDVIHWIRTNKKWILVVIGVVSLPFIWNAINKWLGDSTEPESWNFSDKTFRNKTKPTRFSAKSRFGRGKEKVDPENSQCEDEGGFNIACSVAQSNLWLLQLPNPTEKDKWFTMGHLLIVKGVVGVVSYHFVPYIASLIEEYPGYEKKKMRVSRTSASTLYVSIEDFMLGINYDFVPDDDSDQQKDERYNSINNDWITVKMPNPFQPGKDITKFFVSKDKFSFVSKNISFAMPSLNSNKLLTVHHGMAQVHRDLVVTPDKKDPSSSYVIRDNYVYDNFTSRGDCGAPLFVMNTRTGFEKIFGLHAAGCSSKGASYAGSICREDLEAQLTSYPFNPVPVNYPESGHLDNEKFIDGRFPVLGKTSQGPSACLKSEIIKSHLYGIFPEDPPITKPAHLRPFTKDVDGAPTLIDPWRKSHMKFGKPPPCLDQDILEFIENDYFGNILRTGTNKINVRVFTTQEAIFGIDTCESFNRIECSTSAGYPMNVQGVDNWKKELFRDPDLTNEERMELPVYNTICKRVSEIEAAYLDGYNEVFVYTDNGKDERIEIAKADDGKLRKFCGIPFILLLLFRKHFGAFIIFTMENKVANSIAAGVNPYSDDWNRIAEHLRNDAPVHSVDAGDFSAFDGSQCIDIVLVIFNIIDRWYKLHEDPSQYLVNSVIRRGLWSSKANSIHVSRNIVFEILGNESSGNYGTSVINSMYNILCFRYCAVRQCPDMNFNTQVHIITMGDDVVYSVDTKFKDKFNGLTMPALMKEVGMTYTSETKGVSEHAWRKLSEVEFLKRRFVYSLELGKYIGPMRLNAILEICQWTKARDRYTIMCGNVDCTLGELSLHERNVYEKYQDILVSSINTLRVPLVLPERLFTSWRKRRYDVLEEGYSYLQ